jgi:nucleoside-diphosphate-sugar epimerase
VTNLLAALPSSVRRFLYISTTGVYGQPDGRWVDEDSPCEPTYEGGRIALEAESVVRGHAIGARTIVLRMAGLYGPGRIPRRDELIALKPLEVDADSYLNLIHVDDAAGIVVAVDDQAQPPRTYIVSDGHPVVRREYYAEVARLLGVPLPQFRAGEKPSPEAARGSTNKRINNARLTTEIGYQLHYPSYKAGLAASVAAE